MKFSEFFFSVYFYIALQESDQPAADQPFFFILSLLKRGMLVIVGFISLVVHGKFCYTLCLGFNSTTFSCWAP